MPTMTADEYDRRLDEIADRWERKAGARGLCGPGADRRAVESMNAELERFKATARTLPRRRAATGQPALAEAVAAAVSQAAATRKRARKEARRRRTRESAAARTVREQQHATRPLAVAEAVLDTPLQELSREQLAGLTLAAPGCSPFAEAAPRRGRTAASVAAERAIAEAVDQPGLAERLAAGSAEDLRAQLGERLALLGAAGGYHSPGWRD